MLTGLFLCDLSAFGTNTVYLQPVRNLLVTMLFYQLILGLLQFRAVDFLETAANRADKVIMMIMAVFVLIPLRSVAEIDNPAQIGLAQKLHRPRNCSIPDIFMLLLNNIVQFLHTNMLFGTQKRIHNRITRATLSEPPGSYIIPESIFSFQSKSPSATIMKIIINIITG